MNKGGYATSTASLADDRNDFDYQMAETHMYDQEEEQQHMQDDRTGMMTGQLNQELRGGDNLAEGLAAWRFQLESAHTVLRGEDLSPARDQESEAGRSTRERALNLPIPPSSTSVIPPTQSGVARTEYILTLKQLNKMPIEQLNLEMMFRNLPYGENNERI